ncbi:MAG: hypothetical protein WCE44_06670 [Candidatus Velthaea sp.]
MARLKKQPGTKDTDERYPRVTFTVPPEVAEALNSAWRHHKNIDGSFSQNKSNYIADLILRDAAQSAPIKKGKKPS